MHRQTFIVSLAEFEALLYTQKVALERVGVDIKGLVAYSLYYATHSFYPDNCTPKMNYRTLQEYVSHDLLEQGYVLHSSVVHNCMDFIGEAAKLIVPYLEPILGKFDWTVKLEQFTAGDAVLSVDVSDQTGAL